MPEYCKQVAFIITKLLASKASENIHLTSLWNKQQWLLIFSGSLAH